MFLRITELRWDGAEHLNALRIAAGGSGLTGEAAVGDVEHEARPLGWRLPVTLRGLLLRCLRLLPSILFPL